MHIFARSHPSHGPSGGPSRQLESHTSWVLRQGLMAGPAEGVVVGVVLHGEDRARVGGLGGHGAPLRLRRHVHVHGGGGRPRMRWGLLARPRPHHLGDSHTLLTCTWISGSSRHRRHPRRIRRRSKKQRPASSWCDPLVSTLSSTQDSQRYKLFDGWRRLTDAYR